MAEMLIRLESDFEDYYDTFFDPVDPGPGVYTFVRSHAAPVSRGWALAKLASLSVPTVPFGTARLLRQHLESDRRPDDKRVVAYQSEIWHGPFPNGESNLRLITLGQAMEENPEQLVTYFAPTVDRSEGRPIMIGIYTIGDQHVMMTAKGERPMSSDPERGWMATWGRPQWKHQVQKAEWDEAIELPIWAIQMTQIAVTQHEPPQLSAFDFEVSPRLAGTPIETEIPGEMVVGLIRAAVDRYGLAGDVEEAGVLPPGTEGDSLEQEPPAWEE